jgi:Holliday junction resolvase
MSDRGKGRKFEHEIRHILKAHGFSVVRGAGSKGSDESLFLDRNV